MWLWIVKVAFFTIGKWSITLKVSNIHSQLPLIQDNYKRSSLNYRCANYALSGSRHEIIRPLYPETTSDSSQLPPKALKKPWSGFRRVNQPTWRRFFFFTENATAGVVYFRVCLEGRKPDSKQKTKLTSISEQRNVFLFHLGRQEYIFLYTNKITMKLYLSSIDLQEDRKIWGKLRTQ